MGDLLSASCEAQILRDAIGLATPGLPTEQNGNRWGESIRLPPVCHPFSRYGGSSEKLPIRRARLADNRKAAQTRRRIQKVGSATRLRVVNVSVAPSARDSREGRVEDERLKRQKQAALRLT